MEKEDIIAQFSDVNHLLGNATMADMMDRKPTEGLAVLAQADSAMHNSVSASAAVELPTIEVTADRSFVAWENWSAPPGWSTPDSNYLNLRRGDLITVTQKSQDGKSLTTSVVSTITDNEAGWWLGHSSTDPTLGWMPAAWLWPAGPEVQEHVRRSEPSSPIELPDSSKMAELP